LAIREIGCDGTGCDGIPVQINEIVSTLATGTMNGRPSSLRPFHRDPSVVLEAHDRPDRILSLAPIWVRPETIPIRTTPHFAADIGEWLGGRLIFCVRDRIAGAVGIIELLGDHLRLLTHDFFRIEHAVHRIILVLDGLGDDVLSSLPIGSHVSRVRSRSAVRNTSGAGIENATGVDPGEFEEAKGKKGMPGRDKLHKDIERP